MEIVEINIYFDSKILFRQLQECLLVFFQDSSDARSALLIIGKLETPENGKNRFLTAGHCTA